MKITTQNMILALAALAIALVAFASGCGGGDDDTVCTTVENCPDASPMTADADPTAPDADRTPDASPDPCAEYAQYAGQAWQCTSTSGPVSCTIQIEAGNGVCYIGCNEACVDIPLEDMAAGQYSCTTVPGHNVTCWH